jgi:Protein of unknown function DUF262
MDFNSNTETISWFNDRNSDGSLTLKPPFQRKPIWAARQKCYLIESILLKLPIPEVYMQRLTSPEGKTTYAVVDGQQRIRTVLQFIGSERDPDEQASNKFVLDKLPTSSPWRNYTFAKLSPEEKRQFYDYEFSIRNLNTESDDDLRNMFDRLNRYLSPLKPQELRHSTYRGPFLRLAERLADDEYWAENKIVTTAAIRRMADVEFVSELVIGVLHGPQGGSAAVIDEYYSEYEDYDDEFPSQRSAVKTFQTTLAVIQDLFPEIKQTRWSNKTDFYSLFVALASLSIRSMSAVKQKRLRNSLDKFEANVAKRLKDEEALVSTDVIEYVRAVEKGANDKPRRGVRHNVLVGLISSTIGIRSK